MMNKENRDIAYVKKSTAFVLAIACLVVGIGLGMLYDQLFAPGPKVRKMTVREPEINIPQPAVSQEQINRVLALQRRVTDNPGDASAWAGLGNAFFDTDQFDKAIEAYKKSLEIQPQNANVWTDLGVMYRRSGKPAEAIKAFDRAVSIEPTHEQSRFNKGVVLLHDLKDAAGALAVWEELLKINPAAVTPSGQPVQTMVNSLRTNPN